MQRRDFGKTVGGIVGTSVIGGAALLGASGGAAAISSSLSAQSVSLRNDTGDISEVYVVPEVTTKWEGFDEKPHKVRHILQVKGSDGEWIPVYRETPWLMEDGDPTHGTTDSWNDVLWSKSSDFYGVNDNGRPDSTAKTVLFKDGMDDYYDEASDYPDENHWTGASLGDDAGDYANGNYGVISDTSALDADEDGGEKETTVKLRLITVLLNEDSETVMQDEYPVYGGENYTYDWLASNAGRHPAISIARAQFTVRADNIEADSGSTGTAGTGIN